MLNPKPLFFGNGTIQVGSIMAEAADGAGAYQAILIFSDYGDGTFDIARPRIRFENGEIVLGQDTADDYLGGDFRAHTSKKYILNRESNPTTAEDGPFYWTALRAEDLNVLDDNYQKKFEAPSSKSKKRKWKAEFGDEAEI